MTILVTGGAGLLGSSLLDSIESSVGVTGSVGGSELQVYDLTDPRAVSEMFSNLRPDVVVHCAAMASATACESRPDRARTINVDATKTVAVECNHHNAKLIYISTDYVFATSHMGVDELTSPNPLQTYGRTKREAELLVSQAPGNLIVRLPALYGKPGPNGKQTLSTQVSSALIGSEPLYMDNELVRYPTFCLDVSQVVRQCIERDTTDTLHVSAPEGMTDFEFAQAIAEVSGFDKSLVRPTQYSVAFKRPSNVRLLTHRLRDLELHVPLTFETVVRTYERSQIGLAPDFATASTVGQ